MSLQTGFEALKQRHYQEAIQLLEQVCQSCPDSSSKEYLQAQMGLVKAYQGLGDIPKAIAICEKLLNSKNLEVQTWAQQAYQTLNHQSASAPSGSTKASRAVQTGIKLAMAGVGGNLALASGVTITLLFGMVFTLALVVVFIQGRTNPVIGLGIALGLTLIFNFVMFFLSPWLMDLTQGWLYKTRWVELAEIQRHSPEAARVIQSVCHEKKIKQPRLGIINDQNPTAFTYGSLPNSARLVVSQGIFTYLDDDEVATVYGHELGHIVHWDFAVMTLAATLVQICYLVYITFNNVKRGGSSRLKDAFQTAALVAYIFYIIGTYLVLYLSRTREYFADHFAAEVTGNPNGLSRALVLSATSYLA